MQNSMNSREFPGKSREKLSSREKSVKNPEIPVNSRPGKSREQTLVPGQGEGDFSPKGTNTANIYRTIFSTD